MTALMESPLNPAQAVLDQTCLAGDPWMGTVRAGQTLRILDLEGNQAVDTFSTARPRAPNATAPPTPSPGTASCTWAWARGCTRTKAG